MAGNIQQPLRRKLRDLPAASRAHRCAADRAARGCRALAARRRPARSLPDRSAWKNCALPMPLRRALSRARSISAASAFDAHDAARAPRERQREIAEPAEQIQHARSARSARAVSTAAATRAAIDRAVHLDEVGRTQTRASRSKLGQRSRTAAAAGSVSARTLAETAGLQVEAHAVRAGEFAQQRQILLAPERAARAAPARCALSATATSICGSCSRIGSWPISAASGAISSPIGCASTSQRSSSAT